MERATCGSRCGVRVVNDARPCSQIHPDPAHSSGVLAFWRFKIWAPFNLSQPGGCANASYKPDEPGPARLRTWRFKIWALFNVSQPGGCGNTP
jgi:hypothetical protein